MPTIRNPTAARGVRKPQPKTIKVVCDLCGLDWGLHGQNPTAEKCITLLKAELARRPQYTTTNPFLSQQGTAGTGLITLV